ncbi:MAG: flippase [Deltaproteobacteria bacterium]|nr:flippase [Deltaproteobacteria bacterium]
MSTQLPTESESKVHSARTGLILRILSLAGARFVWRGLGALTLIIIARELGVEEFGLYTAAFSFASLGAMFADAGTSQVVLRSISREESSTREIVGGGYIIQGVLVLAAYGGTLFVSRHLEHDPRLFGCIAIVGLTITLTTAQQIPLAVLQGLERMHLLAIFQAGASALALAAVIFAVTFFGTLESVVRSQLLAACLPFPAILWLALRGVRPKWSLRRIPNILHESASFGILGLFYIVLQQASVVLLERLSTPSEVGLFGAALRPVAFLYVLPQVVSTVLMPRMFKQGVSDPQRFDATSRGMLRYLTGVGFLLSGLVFLTADQIIHILLGSRYVGAAPIMRTLAWFPALQCINYALGGVLTTRDANRLRIYAAVFASFVLIIANLWLIPRHGARGSATATLLAEASFALAIGAAVKFNWPSFAFMRALVPQFLGTAAGASVVWLVFLGEPARSFRSAVGASILFTALYGASLWIFGFFVPEEKNLIRRRFARMRSG